MVSNGLGESKGLLTGLSAARQRELWLSAGETPEKIEKVGVIVVHGIGEQQPGDHLEAVIKPLANAMNAAGHVVTIDRPDLPATGDDAGDPSSALPLVGRSAFRTFGHVASSPPRERASSRPMGCDALMRVHCSTVDPNEPKLVDIAFHEVHWADINELPSFAKGVRFWLWGLSAWLTRNQPPNRTPTYRLTQARPKFRDGPGGLWRWILTRAQLFFVGWVFATLAPILIGVDFFAQRVFGARLPNALTTIVNYVSSIKLYGQPRRHGPGMLEHAIEPPRYAIRRRVARTLARVALAGHDRWYVIAHSQGSVAAFNGLMASAPALAAYISDDQLEALERQGMAGARRDLRDGPIIRSFCEDKFFRPTFPVSRHDDTRIVYRDRLFERFAGLVTYGSPLDKFAAIWPPTVSVSRDIHAFPATACWINVHDPVDPVAGALNAFDNDVIFDGMAGVNDIEADRLLEDTPGQGPAIVSADRPRDDHGLTPRNIAYNAHWLHLLSHVSYFSAKDIDCGSFTRFVSDLLLGTQPPPTLRRTSNAGCRARRMFAFSQLSLFVFIATFLFPIFVDTARDWLCELPQLIGMSAPDPAGLCSVPLNAITLSTRSPVISVDWRVYLDGLKFSAAAIFFLSIIGALTTEVDIAEQRTFRPKTLFRAWMDDLANSLTRRWRNHAGRP